MTSCTTEIIVYREKERKRERERESKHAFGRSFDKGSISAEGQKVECFK